jgi:hypothetical protein
MLLGPAGAAAAAATAEPTPEPSGVVELTLSPASRGLVPADTPLAVTVALHNGTDRTTAGTTVALAVGDQALPDRSTVAAWIAGDSAGVALHEVATTAAGPIAPGDQSAVPLGLPANDPTLATRGPGVYPLLATATVDGAPLSSPSVLVMPEDASPAAEIGVVVPITAPAITRGLLSADDLTALTAADGALTAQLDAVEGTPAILAVDPAIAASIRVLGDAAPSSASAWLERLMALRNSRFALQFGDADLATQLQAGLAQPLAPTSLVSYLPAGTVASPDPAATAPAEPGSPGSPGEVADLAALTDIGDDRANVYWPIAGTAGPEVVAALGSLGSPEAPALTLVPSATTSIGADGARVSARTDAAASALLTYDSAISDLLRAAADENDAAKRNAALAAATAYLTLADGGPPLLVSVDRGTDRSGASLRAAVEAASNAPGVVPVDLARIAAGTASPTEVAEVAADATRVSDLTTLLAEEGSIARFATILDEPALLTGSERAEILQLLGAPWRADAAAAQAAIAEHRAATASTLDSVGILTSGVNLVSYASTLLPVVRNDLPWPVNVTLLAQPDDPRLIVQTRTEVDVQPATNTRAEVPVEAEIANGSVNVAMHLMSPTGEPIGTPQNLGVEVHAEWETVGLVILIVLLVGFFGVGVVRMVLRRRAGRRTDAAASDSEQARE